MLSSGDRATVVLLQAKQSLGTAGLTEFGAAIVAAGAELRILRTGEVPLVREGDDELAGIGAQQVADIDEWPSLIPAGTTAIITNDEYLLGLAAQLCGDLGLPTPIPAGSLENYRHKGVMRRALEAAGIPVPETLIVTEGGVEKTGGCTGFADDELVIVKPAAEANLRGIRTEKFGTVDLGALGDGLVERLLEGPQYHSEVLVSNGTVTPLFSGLYIRSLLDLTKGGGSGSARTTPALEAELAELAIRTCTALGLDGTFTAHVEYLSSGDTFADVVVSEVCARASGGEVPFQSRAIAGIDLELLNLRIQAGLDWAVPTIDPDASGGWMWRVGQPIAGADRIDHLPVDPSFDRIRLGGRARITGRTEAVLAALELLAAANEVP
ncbi:acetyl-CoA carboxylase biotin carboxylase subunit family protein [Nocardia sp. NPDC051321]|uniref:acetyl-CoA carboxylase biotin carboxylase subunit family protein n=1 Tax=Nocardia sp. NPDC051321 TaxID=3364323 RepID=UPI00378B1493